MPKRVPKEMTVEQFDEWCAATSKFESAAEAADEVGGPRLSLVPLPEQNIAWPTDLLLRRQGSSPKKEKSGLLPPQEHRQAKPPPSTAFRSNPRANGSPAGAPNARSTS